MYKNADFDTLNELVGQFDWESVINENGVMNQSCSPRAAENRSRWKGTVANSSVVPRRPSKVMG